jgi:hypothetical protein
MLDFLIFILIAVFVALYFFLYKPFQLEKERKQLVQSYSGKIFDIIEFQYRPFVLILSVTEYAYHNSDYIETKYRAKCLELNTLQKFEVTFSFNYTNDSLYSNIIYRYAYLQTH